MINHLEITVPDYNSFYSLYAEGNHTWKTYDQRKKNTLIYYPPGAVVILYYTYPTYREGCVIRNICEKDSLKLPCLSKNVKVLFRVRASRVDKLRRAAGWLEKNSGGFFPHDDGFYIRLVYMIEQRGKINYAALRELAENHTDQTQI